MRLKTVLGAMATVCTLLATSFAAVPLLISHQGRLLDGDDQPISGMVSITFSFYEVPTGGVALSSETQVVAVENGLFRELIEVPVGTDDVPELWLGLKVGADAEMTPRLRIVSVPYALTSSRVRGDMTTSPGSMAIGDLTGDGRADIVTTSDQSSLTIDDWSTPQGGAHFKGLVSGNSPGTTSLSALYLDVDDDGDGTSESKVVLTAEVSDLDNTAGCGLSLLVDTDEDGFADHEILDQVDAASASTRLVGRSGSTTATIRMAATPDSVVHEDSVKVAGVLKTTSSRKTHANGGTFEMRYNGSGSSGEAVNELNDVNTRFFLSRDKELDGTVDRTFSSVCDDEGAGLAILAGVAVPKFIDITARETGPVPGGTSDVSLVMGLGPDSLVEISADASGSSESFRSPSGHYGWARITVDAGSNMSATNGSGVVALDLNADGRIGIGGSAHATNPVHHSSGAHLTVGGDWTNASDKNLKENFSDVDGEDLLEKIEELPIKQWNYKNEDESITHIGPTAQDFKAAFGVGSDDKSISTVDPSGIALAAVKELNKQNQQLAKQNNQLKKELENLKKKVDGLISRR